MVHGTSQPPSPDLFPFTRGVFPGLFAVLNRLETSIDLPKHFVENLATEDDWSFLIKLHALLEGALTMLLVEHLRGPEVSEPQLRQIIGHVPMSDKQTGKVQWAATLGLLEESDPPFITLLSEFRNDMVHKVEMVGVTLTQHIARMNQGKRKQVLSILCPRIPQATARAHQRSIQATLKEPKVAIWMRGIMLLMQIKLAIDNLVIQRGDLSEALGPDVPKQAEHLQAVAEDIQRLGRLLLAAIKVHNEQTN